MGQVLTKAYSLAIREVKMYNIEKRAEKVISRDKPIPAPKYPTTLSELQRLKEENVSKEYLTEKNNQLDGYLKKVYVTTPQSEPKEVEKNSDQRPLPHSRFTPEESEYGYSESEEKLIPAGRLSLKQALQFIADHRTDPAKHSNTSIATQYKLPVTLIDDILNHFKVFEVHWESKKKDPASQTAYEKLKERVEGMTVLNASQIVKENPQFKRKKLIKNFFEKEKKDKEIIDISTERASSDLQKDDSFKVFEGDWDSKKTDPASQTAYQKLKERVEDMKISNASKVLNEDPQFKREKLIKNNFEKEKKDKEINDISIERVNSDLQKDDKNMR